MSSRFRRGWLSASSREDIRTLAVVCGGLGILWSLGLLVLRIPVLTPLGEQAALSPLYAFLKPSLRWTALVFPLLCILLLSRVRRSLQIESTSRRAFSL